MIPDRYDRNEVVIWTFQVGVHMRGIPAPWHQRRPALHERRSGVVMASDRDDSHHVASQCFFLQTCRLPDHRGRGLARRCRGALACRESGLVLLYPSSFAHVRFQDLSIVSVARPPQNYWSL